MLICTRTSEPVWPENPVKWVVINVHQCSVKIYLQSPYIISKCINNDFAMLRYVGWRWWWWWLLLYLFVCISDGQAAAEHRLAGAWAEQGQRTATSENGLIGKLWRRAKLINWNRRTILIKHFPINFDIKLVEAAFNGGLLSASL